MESIVFLWLVFLIFIPSIWIGIKAEDLSRVCGHALIFTGVNVILFTAITRIGDFLVGEGFYKVYSFDLYLTIVMIFLIAILHTALITYGLKWLFKKNRKSRTR